MHTVMAGEKSSKKAARSWLGMCFITMVTWAAEVSWPGVADTSASCLTVSCGKASICVCTQTNTCTTTNTKNKQNKQMDKSKKRRHNATGRTAEKWDLSICRSLKDARTEKPPKFFCSHSPLLLMCKLQLGSEPQKHTQQIIFLYCHLQIKHDRSLKK